MATLFSALIAIACALASGRRLVWAVATTSLDPHLLVEALRQDRSSWPRWQAAIETLDEGTWERNLVAALSVGDETARVALVDEQLRELDWRSQRWRRVPRVCASIATTAGFLAASLALLGALDGTGGVAGEPTDVGSMLASAVGAMAVGIAGASFCFSVQVRARRIVRDRIASADRLVDRLEALAAVTRQGGQVPI